MTTPDDDLIERCARVAETAVAELRAILKSAASRKSQYDRQTRLQLLYAIRWVSRVAARIRSLADKE